MSSEALTTEILRSGEVERRRFDPKSSAPFGSRTRRRGSLEGQAALAEEERRDRRLQALRRPLLLRVPEKEAADHHLKLDGRRRGVRRSGGEDAYLFQPHTDYRTLRSDKPLSTRMAQKVVKRRADYSMLGDLSPHDLRRAAVTRALESGLSYRQVQMMSKRKDPKTVMRYDRGRENMELNAGNFFMYDEE